MLTFISSVIFSCIAGNRIALRRALCEMPGSPTIFIVSQRTSSIQYAYKIIVLDDGEIIGVGKHDELLETCEVYHEVFDSQFRKEERCAIDFIIGPGNVSFTAVARILVRIGFVVGIAALFQWLTNTINNNITYHVVRDVRKKAFRKIEILPLSYIDSHSHGETGPHPVLPLYRCSPMSSDRTKYPVRQQSVAVPQYYIMLLSSFL